MSTTVNSQTHDVFTVRDDRRHNFHIIDNEIYDIYGPILGVAAIAIYGYLVRRSNNSTHSCYPSKTKIAHDVGCSERAVYNALQKLSEHGLITIEKRFTEDGLQSSNKYILNDIKCLAEGQANIATLGRQILPPRSANSADEQYPINNTQIKKNLIKSKSENEEAHDDTQTETLAPLVLASLVDKKQVLDMNTKDSSAPAPHKYWDLAVAYYHCLGKDFSTEPKVARNKVFGQLGRIFKDVEISPDEMTALFHYTKTHWWRCKTHNINPSLNDMIQNYTDYFNNIRINQSSVNQSTDSQTHDVHLSAANGSSMCAGGVVLSSNMRSVKSMFTRGGWCPDFDQERAWYENERWWNQVIPLRLKQRAEARENGLLTEEEIQRDLFFPNPPCPAFWDDAHDVACESRVEREKPQDYKNYEQLNDEYFVNQMSVTHLD